MFAKPRHYLSVIRAVSLGLVALGAVAGGLVVVPPVPATAATSPPPPAVHVHVTAAGFQPATINVVVGQTTVFDNESSAERIITADDGTFDSGVVPTTGSFALTLSQPGLFGFSSPGDPPLRGTLVVGLSGLSGTSTTKVSDVIPDLDFPGVTDLTAHPEYGLRVSRTRLVVLPSATATVAAFNDLLGANGLTIIGGLRNAKELVVATTDPGDTSRVTAVVGALRASSLVKAATLDFEVVDESAPRPVPTPSQASDPLATWTWNDPGAKATAPDANWGMRDVRAPAAWNLLDAARVAGQPAVLAVDDVGFDATHPDVKFVEVVDPCRVYGVPCITPTKDHGTHVAGIIGARYDNAGPDATHTTGVAGVDPMAAMYGFVERGGGGLESGDGYDYASLARKLDEILDQTDTGEKMAGLRAINVSMGAATFQEQGDITKWWNAHPLAGKHCGPAFDDDATEAALLPCYPGNDDKFHAEFVQLAATTAPVIQVAAAKRVIIVKSAGNSADSFCIDGLTHNTPGSGCTAGFDQLLPMSVAASNEFAVARAMTGMPNPSPVLIVEAHDVNDRRATFSLPGGDISAPGVKIVSTVPTNTNGFQYEAFDGTSMAAPFVTGALGYLFSIKPSTDWVTYRQALITSAAPGIDGTPRLDVFAAAVKLNLLRSAVDVNDWSADGDRRVFYNDYGTPLALDTTATKSVDGLDAELGPRRAEPDGKVDMRDFRRFRDAWLQTCQEGSAGTQAGPAPACPAQIALDGPADHPKKDGNGDRCVAGPTANCQSLEGSWSRFDANGDGRLDVYAGAPLALDAQGRPTTPTTSFTDLSVLQTYFDATTAATEGWAKTDLPRLLVSADLDVRLDEFWAAGATNVSVATTADGVATGPARTFAKPAAGTGGGIVTVPVAPGGSKVELVASATAPEGTALVSTPVVGQLAAGGDLVASPCVAQLKLTLDAPALLPGKETGVTAQLHDCKNLPSRPELDGRPVTFAVEAAGTAVPVLTTAPATTMDATGKATAGLRAGDGTGTFTIHADVTLGNGTVLRATADVTISPQITMAYHWRSALDTYTVNGTTRWSGSPDCTTTGVPYCIEDMTETAKPPADGQPAYVVERSGTLTATKDGVKLSERVDGGSALIEANFTWTDLARGTTSPAVKRYGLGIAAADQFRYTDTTVPVDIKPVNDEVWVSGLRSLAALGYRGVLNAGGSESIDAKEIAVPGEFFLSPRADGSSIAYAADRDRVLRFQPANQSNAAGYQWCGTTGRDLTEPPGYYAGNESPWVIGATDVERDTHYDAGDYPLLTTTGTLRFDVAFAATMSIGTAPAEPQLPSCDGPNPPTADFTVVNPAPIEEGEAVQFVDRSVDVDGDIAAWSWNFGGAGSSTVQDATFGQGFRDEGTYPVTLTVTDAQGHSADFTNSVTVVNAKPTVDVAKSVVLATAQVPVSISARVDDPGEHDRASLAVTLTSSNPAFGAARTVHKPAGDVRFDIAGLPAGEYPLTVTVADDANATATATAVLYVSAVSAPTVPAPPVPPVIVSASGCTTPVPLDAEEAVLFDRINGQRAAVGLPALVVSTELTSAAQRNARDQLAHGTLSADGSDGSTSASRVVDAGYPPPRPSRSGSPALVTWLRFGVSCAAAPPSRIGSAPAWR